MFALHTHSQITCGSASNLACLSKVGVRYEPQLTWGAPRQQRRSRKPVQEPPLRIFDMRQGRASTRHLVTFAKTVANRPSKESRPSGNGKEQASRSSREFHSQVSNGPGLALTVRNFQTIVRDASSFPVKMQSTEASLCCCPQSTQVAKVSSDTFPHRLPNGIGFTLYPRDSQKLTAASHCCGVMRAASPKRPEPAFMVTVLSGPNQASPPIDARELMLV